jgi:hypothetical protein
VRTSAPFLVAPLAAVAVACSAFGACNGTPGLGAGGQGGSPLQGPVNASSTGGGIISGSGGASIGKLGARCTNPLDAGPDASADASASGAGGSSTGGSATGGAANAGSSCGDGLTCVDSATDDPIFGGGPPGGFCTKSCMSDTDCAHLGGVCYMPDPTQAGRCTLTCTIGPAATSVGELFTSPSGLLRSSKCLGRDDLRCVNTTATAGVCLPTCGDANDCSGRACDPRVAVCVDAPNTGKPTGAACDPNELPTPCAGSCVLFQTGIAMCSSPCVLGGAPATVDGGPLMPLPEDCGGASNGICAFHPVTNGAGDTGSCSPACVQQGDCAAPSFWCFSVRAITPTSQKGYCFSATPCPNGQTDCTGGAVDAGAPDASGTGGAGGGGTGGAGGSAAADAGPDAAAADAGADGGAGDAGPVGLVCTQTPLGAYCLDPAFPLGDLPDASAPDAGDGG